MPTSKQIYQGLIMENPTKMWTTEIWAVPASDYWEDNAPNDYFNKQFQGPHVPGTSLEDAQRYCNEHGMGYCRVTGELIAEGEIDTVLDNNN